ncbi:helix-turn-helix transcriptional regulator [Bacteroidales bacterium OttesenSCG-928-B11]|nr:helix-turn-helix transcriptional regulator [Bacteroidales bacterium OttesenSCG-928-C03]MDL2311631.1 helix-turn-helix transcriptional regulator [Bacteroidales bacterium OttesenSCG-928-B11]
MELNRIKEVLGERGIKQTWLAEKLGKSFNMVNAYVCNRKQPSLETLNRISELLQVDMKDLIVDKNENKK